MKKEVKEVNSRVRTARKKNERVKEPREVEEVRKEVKGSGVEGQSNGVSLGMLWSCGGKARGLG